MSDGDKPLISIAIPVFNEEENIPRLYERLSALAARMADRCRLEFVFSDNASSDGTWRLLSDLSRSDPRVKAIRFSKNFGFQRSILANYLHAQGDAIMQIDADLQDPPELLEAFFDKWKDGHDVVYGIRRRRPEGPLLHAFRRFGYWFIDKLSEHPIPRDVGDFRLVDRKIVEALRQMRTTSPYLRGMIAGMGFRQVGIPYDRDARVAGESKFNVPQLIRLGLSAVFNHSTVPLRVASFLGIAILCVAVLSALYYLALRLAQPELPQGLASIHILVLFGIGLNAFLMGVIGEYLLRIYLLLRSEPIAIVSQSLNLEPAELKL